jgi:hypothetical protein
LTSVPTYDPDSIDRLQMDLRACDLSALDLSNSLMDSRTTASPLSNDEYVFYREGGWSWAIPYIAGVYALAVQVEPAITPDQFWSLAMQTGRTIELDHNGETVPLGPIIDPVALIGALRDL